jgi:2-polyprenyl-6-methoxyphenol hydroxylase-like FAD-dependent oxidoreductase
MKVLRAIGVEDNVRKVAGRSHWQFMRNWKTGRVIAKTSRQQQAASFGTEGATVHRADLLDVLAEALSSDVVTLGKRCTEVRPDGDIAVARFADGGEIEADVIVGAADVKDLFRIEGSEVRITQLRRFLAGQGSC